jgi:hypothetical protein
MNLHALYVDFDQEYFTSDNAKRMERKKKTFMLWDLLDMAFCDEVGLFLIPN